MLEALQNIGHKQLKKQGVFTLPGMTRLTRTSSCRMSSIIASVIPTRPNLLAL